MTRILAALLVAALLTGCASIIHGSRQDIRVTSAPSGAVVRVNSHAVPSMPLTGCQRGCQRLFCPVKGTVVLASLPQRSAQHLRPPRAVLEPSTWRKADDSSGVHAPRLEHADDRPQ